MLCLEKQANAGDSKHLKAQNEAHVVWSVILYLASRGRTNMYSKLPCGQHIAQVGFCLVGAKTRSEEK